MGKFFEGLKNKTPVSTKPFWQRVNNYRKKDSNNDISINK